MINYTDKVIFVLQNHQPVNGNMHLRLLILILAFTQELNTQDDHIHVLKRVNLYMHVFQNPSTEWKYAFEICHFICFCSKQCEKILIDLHNERLLDCPN